MFDYREAAAAVAAALDDPKRSLIGDPSEGRYWGVSLITSEMKEAMQFARQLAGLGIIPTTNITHDQFGNPALAHVHVYRRDEQEALLEIVQEALSEPRRRALTDLVLARGPIPEDILEKIWISHHRGGRRPGQIAERMNELGVIAGRRKRWTAQKVQKALAEYEGRREQHQEAA
jgi:hypothetical protein